MLCGRGVGRVYLPRVQQLDLEIHCVRVTTSKCARGPPQVHSVLCCAIFYQTTTVPVRSLRTTPNFYYVTVSVCRSRYMNYSVSTFLGSNWNRTVSIFMSSIRSVTTFLVSVHTALKEVHNDTTGRHLGVKKTLQKNPTEILLDWTMS